MNILILRAREEENVFGEKILVKDSLQIVKEYVNVRIFTDDSIVKVFIAGHVEHIQWVNLQCVNAEVAKEVEQALVGLLLCETLETLFLSELHVYEDGDLGDFTADF